MRVVTRFCPTANGSLHVGHAYTALVNYNYAREHNGTFILRFDDSSPTVRLLEQSAREKIIEGQLRDLKWLGIRPDVTYLESDYRDKVQDPLDAPEEDPESVLPLYARMAGTGWLPIPWIPAQTWIRVKLDYMDGVTHVIRGEEWATEFGIYAYFCWMQKLPIPRFMFLPRITSHGGNDISKTAGGFKISDLRASGWTRKKFIFAMEKSVLSWPPNGWELWNLKPNPVWGG
jgi:glutamyl/glutaminyl-tRNA synthetase